jgi:hypothetical protein
MALVEGDGGGYIIGGSAAWWPGLTVPAGTMEMDPGEVRTLAGQLEDLLADLTNNSPGTVEDLYTRSDLVAAENSFGGWDTAVAMKESYLEALDTVAECYNRLRQQLASAILRLHDEAYNVDGIDTDVASRLDASMSGALDTGAVDAGAPYPTGTTGTPAAGTPEVAATPGMTS